MFHTTLEAMLAVQFGGSDNIRVDCSATGESWRGGGYVSVKCVCLCVISVTKGVPFISKRLVRGRDRSARLPNAVPSLYLHVPV